MDTEKARALAEGIGSWINPKSLLQNFGTLGVMAIIFAETGLLVGFFFPGDSLLFLAGVGASSAAETMVGVRLPLAALLIGTPLCAIAGAQLGHFLGARYGRRMFERPDSRLFKREYVERTEYYFNRFGPGKAVLLARFTPIIRTFLNPMAGVLEMPARTFLLWNVVGGVIWTEGVLLTGYFLGDKIKNVIPPDKIDTYLLPVIALIVLLSLLPIIIEVIRQRREGRRGGADARQSGGGAHRAVAGNTPAAPRTDTTTDRGTPDQPATRRRL